MLVGIDVAKAEAVVSVVPALARFSVANDERGARTLVERLRPLQPPLIVIEATGQLAKTDRIDADILARFADVVRPEVRLIADAESQELEVLLTRHRQLLEMLQAERNCVGQVFGEGKRAVRKSLQSHMAALVASKHNAVIASFYQRLVAAGKPKRLALVACMRKLLTILNVMIRTHTAWDQSIYESVAVNAWLSRQLLMPRSAAKVPIN